MDLLTWLILSADLPFWIRALVCAAIALLIALFGYGLFALIDIHRINKKDDIE